MSADEPEFTHDVEPDEWFDPEWVDPDYEDRTCESCGGDGMEDDVMPCPVCDGEGYYWWE